MLYRGKLITFGTVILRSYTIVRNVQCNLKGTVSLEKLQQRQSVYGFNMLSLSVPSTVHRAEQIILKQ